MTTARGHIVVRRAARNGHDGTGVSIVSQTVKYAASTSGTTRPSAWSTTIPTVAQGNFLWTWTHVLYSDGNYTDAYSVSRQGVDGRGIQSSVVTYSQQATSVDPATISDWGSFPSVLTDGYWLYTKTHIVYSDTSSTDSYSVSQVGTGSYYAGVEKRYAAGSSDSTAPQGAAEEGTYPAGTTPQTTWSQTRPALTSELPYLWNFEISRDSRGNSYVTAALCIGNFAKGIQSMEQSYAISAQGSIPSGHSYPTDISAWVGEHQAAAPTNSKPYQWNKTVITYNDSSTDESYHVSAIKGADGKGTIYIDLENENDSILYDGQGNKVGGSAVCPIRLYENGADITSGKTFRIEASSGINASVTGSTLTVSDISVNSGYVTVQCTYNSVTYYARMTVKRLQGVDKYELLCTPSAVTVNTTTGAKSSSTIKVEVYRTAQNGNRQLLSSLPTGYTLKVNGQAVTYSSSKHVITVDAAQTDYIITLNAGQALADTETVPVSKTANGADGNDGADGNSITSNTFYFMLTEAPDAPAASDSGWKLKGSSDCPIVGTDAQPYLWRKEHIVYSQTPAEDVISLVSVTGISKRSQLLDQSDFAGIDKWDSWDGEIIPGQGDVNSYGALPAEHASYTELLRQRVMVPNQYCKLEGGKYYCLSFLVRDRRYVNVTTNKYGVMPDTFYLRAGTYKIEFNGHISAAAAAAGVSLAVYIFNSDWSKSVSATSSAANDSTVRSSGSMVVTTAGYYQVGIYAYSSTHAERPTDETVTCNWYRIVCTTDSNELLTYLYGGNSCIDGTSPSYVDGVANRAVSSDGCTSFRLDNYTSDSDGWQYHWVSWKLKATIPSDAIKMILFRIMRCYVEICMPKLEQSVMPTEWCRNESDPTTEPYNICGAWQSGTRYYYTAGQRDVVSAPVSAGGANTWFRMAKRTSPSGWVSSVQPYLDPEHWESGNHLRFTVTDLMFAEEIFSDKITAKKVRAVNGDYEAQINPNADYPVQVGLTGDPIFRVSKTGVVFGANVRLSVSHITSTNWNRYVRTDLQTTDREIDFNKIGGLVHLGSGVNIEFSSLPILASWLSSRYTSDQKYDIRSYVGTFLRLYNESGRNVSIVIDRPSSGIVISTTVPNGDFSVLECVLAEDSNHDEHIYWVERLYGNIV